MPIPGKVQIAIPMAPNTETAPTVSQARPPRKVTKGAGFSPGPGFRHSPKDETLILSGLSERETIKVSSRVPVLGDVPIVQNMFSRGEESQFTKSVLMLLTPRRIANFDTTVQAAEKFPLRPQLRSASLAHEGVTTAKPQVRAGIDQDRRRSRTVLR